LICSIFFRRTWLPAIDWVETGLEHLITNALEMLIEDFGCPITIGTGRIKDEPLNHWTTDE
jgi:hypothetical protein